MTPPLGALRRRGSLPSPACGRDCCVPRRPRERPGIRSGCGRSLLLLAHSTTPKRRAARWLSEHDSKELLRSAGVTVPDGRLVRDEDDAAAALAELGGPLVMKLSSAAVQHKTELGGVELDLHAEAEMRGAYRRLAALAAEHGGAVLAERMAAPGVELLVAARTDTIVPVLVIGLGGIWTELLDDVAIVPLPASSRRIERALLSLRGASIFAGGRGRTAGDIRAAVALIQRCGDLLLASGIELIELNPVLIGEHGAVAVDASVRVRADRPATTHSSGPVLAVLTTITLSG